VACTDDSCDEATDAVVNTPNDANCDNGQFCDGAETCDAVNDCQAGTAPSIDDGVACTDDSCDEATDTVVNTPNNANCPDDGLFCNGDEFCDPFADCTSTGDPCSAETVCSEDTDTCDLPAHCGDGNVDPGEVCDEGADNGTTVCGCQINCTYASSGTSCSDEQFCNGDETCNGVGNCQSGTSPNLDDGVGCTDDSCNETTDTVVNTPNDANCTDDGVSCNGVEFCDPVNDCSSTYDVCSVIQTCDVLLDDCINDVDNDGDVDIVDIMTVATRFNCFSGDGCYDARYDLDGDGDIDIVDVMRVAVQFGWISP
jgi:hypothetical protein